ncbi:hypothetical protein D3870_14605 [Noviherbaspirillum cavernae]|uniref:PcRGLX/YetA-like N-terminal RIFT barrel domain-containing protein n=1 Tax=Noviherbaspirillum cavernae TaxID=2320862 RepID=A0A418X6J4_9BURK|nr:hypothetical protein D3870_14605 [Noviherbaspirillum cavernae]
MPVTFGQVFAQGDVPQANSLTGKLADGTMIPLQVDVKATHPDGSMRHGIFSAIMPQLLAGQTQKITLVKTDKTAAPASAPAELLNAGFAADVSINLAGQTYGASAAALLAAGKYTSWISGPVANEWIVSAPLMTADGIEHPHLAARFAIRSYAGLNKAKVDVIIENNWAYVAAPQNFTYDVQVNVGGQTAYTKAALTHYHHARWRKTFWWGTAPQVHVRHHTAYLIATKAVPNYDRTFSISPVALTSIRTKFSGAVTEPMRNGLAVQYMPQTGGRPDIGLLPGWAATYLLSMDRDAKIATLGTADLAGSWSTHYRDKNTDRPVSLVDYPYMTILGRSTDTFNPATKKYEAFPACGGVCTNPHNADASHQPGFAYLPYVVTGEHYYLEELQFWAMWNLFQSNPGYRGNVKGLFHATQVRGQAWILRTLAEAAYIMPDSDRFKAQFAKFLSDNLDWYNTTYASNPNPDNSLGAIIDANAIVYDGGRGIAPWQDDFFTAAAGHAAELGFEKAQTLLAWKAKFPVSRMVGPGFCWILGSIYSLHVRDTTSGPIYTSIGQAYQASNPPALTALSCASAEMAANLGLKLGEMVGYSSDNAGFPSNMQPALAYSADSGIADAAKAWTVFMGRSVKPNYYSGPQFAIVPR